MIKSNLESKEQSFESRHLGPSETDIAYMLQAVNAESMDQLIKETIPTDILNDQPLSLPPALDENQYLEQLKVTVGNNTIFKSYIGMGYYGCFTPGVIQRNILENPGWYTAYTPYQAEIAQGRLEALINFQTMVIDLTGMEVANASLLDEGTAAAEAMSMFYARRKGSKRKATRFFADKNSFPQTLDVLKTRANSFGIQLVIDDLDQLDLTDDNLFGVFVQYPNDDGEIIDHEALIASAKEAEVKIVVAADLLSLTVLRPPGEIGADAVVGTSQRFGIPMGYGGPHAAYFASKEEFKRQMPGRIIGASKDRNGQPAYRMALQTREQHIRREKATSNICTAQVLLAVMAGMYAVYHGPQGLRRIASRVHSLARLLHDALVEIGFSQTNTHFFDTLKIQVEKKEEIRKLAEEQQLNFRYFDDDFVGISLDETTGLDELRQIVHVFQVYKQQGANRIEFPSVYEGGFAWPETLNRSSDYMQHPVFHGHQTEHELLRYMKQLENKDLSLVHSMISLGSCTMKLNATTEMIPVTWPEIGQIHPFAPESQVTGYTKMIGQLATWLEEITGFDRVSLQPNSGAQGEYAGLMVIKAYQEDQGQGHRDITLIPSSAHGTNPASAVMAGYKVVIVQCDENGNIDVGDLKIKASENAENLAALMITYPSTHGVFEEQIREICSIVHEHGGQVYMDGANMNAQVGLTSPAIVGADVCHLNLHKTFCIPHGGGGPGMGPIGVAPHLSPFLPGNVMVPTGGSHGISAISAAPFGSASILVISHAYIAMMGSSGLKKATEVAILNANYMKERLSQHYPILYTGANGRCAHEMIIDCRSFKKFGVEVIDIAKRLMDYGFHAPTVSFPVPGTMMIEPTESEPLAELDRFCDSLISIRNEIIEIQDGAADPENNVLVNAPHTMTMACAEDWSFPYKRKKAVFPLPFVEKQKFWPAVARVDDAYGDRNLVCTCLPIEAYMTDNQE